MPDHPPRGSGEAEARERVRGWMLGGGAGDDDLDAYRSAVRAAYREEVMAEMDRWIATYPPDIDHLGKVQPAGETLRLMLPRVKASIAALTPRPTEDG